MTPPANASQSPALERVSSRINRYRGYVIYIYAFDVAYDMKRGRLTELLGQPVAQFTVDPGKRSPRQLVFYSPQTVRLPPTERLGPGGAVRVERAVKILPVGAISITVRVPFSVESLDELVCYHDLRFNNGSVLAEARRLAEDVRNELAPHAIRPVQRLGEEEAYTVFYIQSPPETADGSRFSAEEWLAANRRGVASLLTQEQDVAHLSDQEVDESCGRYLSYYDHDLLVVDWDAALLIDVPQYLDETLYVIELANVQLTELEAYDRLLDEGVERSYRDLEQRRLRGRADVLRGLRELRIDLARLSDELQNISKFFGDWHLARIYQALSARFHLGDWHRSIDEKLRTLDDLYGLHKQDQTNRIMIWLETAIVLLFVIDIVALFMGLDK